MNDPVRSRIDCSPRISGVTRRSLVKGAAWSVPAISLAAALPAAAASPTDIGAFSLDGDCGTLGILNPGFVLTASPTAAIPIGTTINISGTGVANIGVFSVTDDSLASVAVLTDSSRRITITGAVPKGSAIEFRTTLSISVAFTLSATATLPPNHIGTGAKTSAGVESPLIGLCSDS